MFTFEYKSAYLKKRKTIILKGEGTQDVDPFPTG